MPTYSISDLAREFDLTTRAMRFYEDMGLLRPRTRGARWAQTTSSGRDRARPQVDVAELPKGPVI